MPRTTHNRATADFSDLGLPTVLLRALTDVGYETPSPIQLEAIPALLAGRDLVGQAQTGTGKTAAFALPILARLDLARGGPQALVLTPTRELAIQVAEAFQRYAVHLARFHVLPIYGGQGYGPQLAGLKRRPHVVIGTPGRIIDHIERGTLDLTKLTTLVLDEGDEMLRMGFVEEVEKVLAVAPANRQLVLFSATMPAQVRRIAKVHLREPIEVTIHHETTTVAGTRQRSLMVSSAHKLDVLTRILEVEPFDAMLVFTRTKVASEDLAQRLAARGFAAAPLHGDIAQAQRERTVARLKKREIDILVATDVAARGLDVGRISHVVNFDIPIDIESYVHRIGRTGRAGRSGEAIVFVTHRERHLLHAIERATGQRIVPMATPSVADVNAQRVARFKERITAALAEPAVGVFRQIVEQYVEASDVPIIEIAAALAVMAQGKAPILEPDSPHDRDTKRAPRTAAAPAQRGRPAPAQRGRPAPAQRGRPAPAQRDRPAPAQRDRPAPAPGGPLEPAPHARPVPAPRAGDRGARGKPGARGGDSRDRNAPDRGARRRPEAPQQRRTASPGKRRERPGDIEMERYRVAVGRQHGVKAGNLLGAIANEAGLDSEFIGRIDIGDDHSFVELPVGMPRELVRHMKKVWVAGQQLRLAPAGDEGEQQRARPARRADATAKARSRTEQASRPRRPA